MSDHDNPPMLNGQAVLDSRWGFEQVLGADRVARAVAALPEETRAVYEGVTPLSWVPYPVITEVHDALAREAGASVEDLLSKVIPRAIERTFSTGWRVLLRLTTDRALIARTPLLYKRSRSHGNMQSRLLEKGHATVELTGWAGIPPRDIHALSISIESLMRVAGRAAVSATPERTPEGVKWTVRWTG